MKKYFLLFLVLCLSTTFSFSQKKTITADQAILQRAALSPKRLSQLQWVPGTTDYVYTDTLNKEQILFRSTFSGSATPYLKLAEVNSALKAISADTLARWSLLSFKSKDELKFSAGGQEYIYQLVQKNLSKSDAYKLPEDAEVSENGPDGKVAYVSGNNIYVVAGGAVRQVTSDGGYEIVYGKSVHREEFGIDKGLFWTSDGSSLAFYRMDQSMVTDYPIVDWTAKPAKEKQIKYPFSGEKSHHVTLGVYNLQSGKITYLKTGEPAEQYLTNIAWRPDGKSVFIAVVNRDQNFMKLNEYSAVTGEFIRTLFEEREEKYVEPLTPMEFVNGKNQFVWMSRRDGYNHAYLYDLTSGKLIRQLTNGKWEVVSVTGMDEKGTRMIIQCTVGGAINRDYCSVGLNDGKMKRLTQEAGMHNFVMHPSTNYFLDTYSDLQTPGVTVVRDMNGKVIREIYRAANPLEKYATGKVKIFPLIGVSGDTLWSRMVLPVDFDSSKKYPAVLYVYGGPHLQLVNNGWMGSADLSFQALAAKGYIVFSLDNRGTPYRGKAFEQAVHRQLGVCEMQDQMTGVNYMKSLKYVDSTRLGVNGWSFGGFMTTSLMTRNPGVFKVAVAGGPVIDWSMYEVMYTERYMDTPEQNPEGYKTSELTQYVGNLKGKLMLIHGTSDDVVVWQHSLGYLKKSISSGVQVDYMVYPGHLHNVMGKDRAHLMNKMYTYFEENL
jgi:dipeptidyl-peptidase-4